VTKRKPPRNAAEKEDRSTKRAKRLNDGVSKARSRSSHEEQAVKKRAAARNRKAQGAQRQTAAAEREEQKRRDGSWRKKRAEKRSRSAKRRGADSDARHQTAIAASKAASTRPTAGSAVVAGVTMVMKPPPDANPAPLTPTPELSQFDTRPVSACPACSSGARPPPVPATSRDPWPVICRRRCRVRPMPSHLGHPCRRCPEERLASMSAQEDAGSSDKTNRHGSAHRHDGPQPTVARRCARDDASPTAAPRTVESARRRPRRLSGRPCRRRCARTKVPRGARVVVGDADGPTGKGGTDGKRMSLLEHLGELRSRLAQRRHRFRGGYDRLVRARREILRLADTARAHRHEGRPTQGSRRKSQLLRQEPDRAFWVYMKLAIVGGLILAGPLSSGSSGGSWRRASTARRGGSPCSSSGSTVGCFAVGSVFAYLVLCEPAAYFLTKLLTISRANAHFHLSP